MKKRKALWIILLILAVLCAACVLYLSDYYRAEPRRCARSRATHSCR